MKKINIKLFSICILLLLLIEQTTALDTNIVKFFPLKVGNVWVYQCYGTGGNCYCNKRNRVNIINSINLNMHRYFLFQTSTIVIQCLGFGCNCALAISFDTLRVDSSNGNVYKYSYSNACPYLNHEIMIDSLKARLNDKPKINCGADSTYKCYDTSSHSILGAIRETRGYAGGIFEFFYNRAYAKGIGISSWGASGIYGSYSTTLVGCVLNGVVIGDTTYPVGIKPISNEIPESFSLSQNYPNPFNPSTKIKFDIPHPQPLSNSIGEGDNIVLKIYDILGREVATLVNGKLQPGSYEVEWDASEYPSGIYFYQLTISDPETNSGFVFSETRKMVLIK